MRVEQNHTADYTRSAAGRRLNVCLTTIDKLIADGVLQAYKLGSGRRAGRRIRHESVEKLRNGK